jgi:DNA invertase Pin-like site-specific DNA recombinase
VSLRQVAHHAQPPLGQLVDLLSDLVQGTHVSENASRRRAIPHLRGRSGGRTWNARTVIAGAAYEDQASGTSLDRPGLQHALDLAREKRIGLLLVYRVDRLSPKVRQLAGLCEELDSSTSS